MGRPPGWITERTGRAPMRSPGRPGVNQREAEQAFWVRIAAGASSEEAALASGVSQPLGPRWFREAGGMAPISLVGASGRYLSFAEREELALLHAQGLTVREIAKRMGRSSSTVSRELRRNATTRGGVLRYRATVAQWKAERFASRPKTAKLTQNARLRTYVQDRLAGLVADTRGKPIPGPRVSWKGRRHGRRADPSVGQVLEPTADQLVLEHQRFGDDGADSAGGRKLGRVTINWNTRKAKSRIVEQNYQGFRSVQDRSYIAAHAMICEFASDRVACVRLRTLTAYD